MFTKAKLLAFLAGQSTPYTGGDDLAKVKAYIAEQNLDLQGLDGKAIDIDALFAVKSRTTLVVDDADPNAVTLTGTEAETYRKSIADGQKNRGSGKARTNLGEVDAPAVHTSGNAVARKNYQGRIAKGVAKFQDVDHAEYIGATLRLASMSPQGGQPYGHRADDEAIVANVHGKTGSSTSNTSYGFLIPEEVTTAVMYNTEPVGVVRRIANVQKMSRDTWSGNRKTAIVTMTHLAESGTLTNVDSTFDRVQLTAKQVGCIVRLPTSLLEDSAVSIADDYAQTFVEAQQIREDSDAFIGDGSATYGGHSGLANGLRSGAYIAQTTSNTWAAQTLADFHKLMGSVENADGKRLAFLCSRQYWFQVMQRLQAAGGGNTMLSLAAANGMAGTGMGGADANFLGYPVYFSQILPIITATTAKSCYFGDIMGGMTLGDRRGLRVETSKDFYFSPDEYAIRATARIAVNCHSDGRSGTFGNIVCLKNG